MEQEQKPRERSFIRELVPNWRPSREQVLWTVRIVIVLVVLLGILTLVGLPFGITLWEWLKLLIVPAVIAAGGLWFNRQQRNREMEIAEQRSQDEALQAYLEQMSQLLTDKDQPLHKAQQHDSLSTLARARTLTVLTRLDGERKRSVLQFLYESRLITKNRVVVDLGGANLENADLRFANLEEGNLSGAYLHEAILFDANLVGADLSDASLYWANLVGANLVGADLRGASLLGASLRLAHLSGTDLRTANLDEADLRETDLSGAHLNGGNLFSANLSEANLNEADLRETDLTAAYLRGAHLEGAHLEGAILPHLKGADMRSRDYLRGADLRGANLTKASRLTNEELERQVKTLEGATMPNGQKYEDWRKSKGLGEDGENSGPS